MSVDQLAELAKSGPAWALLIFVALPAIVYLYKGRMADWKELGELVRNFTATLREWLTANEPRTRALEANAKGAELMAAALNNLAGQVERLGEIVKDTNQSNRELRDLVLKLSGQLKSGGGQNL